MIFRRITLLVLVIFMVSACKTNPFTGKKTLNAYSNDQLFPMAFQQYDQFLNENKVIKGTKDAEMITRVGERIATAAERWLNANGHEGYLKDYKWEYNLVDDKTVNAWCMPGGKIVFYTGILPVASNETAIAAIMGHEVAHALANHGGQRMTAGQIQQGIAVAGTVGMQAGGVDAQKQQMIMQAYGVGSQVGGMLPFSRSHETEADKIGLILMAIAGYNPDEASKLWERMKANSGGQAPPEILSTHPSNDSRIDTLKELAPNAKEEAKKFGITSFRPLGNF
ncbi:M48 family metallopeptidase [Pseudofulvibacter geojedonensis]|uniref:M48 family metallopeptidase n=1 Tax=Pseudofulvibacter geojedonensis TaxID=1123758 RepID=A0ABW3HYU0_9FLAO